MFIPEILLVRNSQTDLQYTSYIGRPLARCTWAGSVESPSVIISMTGASRKFDPGDDSRFDTGWDKGRNVGVVSRKSDPIY